MRKGLLLFLMSVMVWRSRGRRPPNGPRDILGNWCGTVSNYSITRDTLQVTIRSNNSVRKYKIDNFEFTSSVVTVNWRSAKDEEVWTKFSEFSADGLNMVQLSNEAGPAASSAAAERAAHADRGGTDNVRIQIVIRSREND